MVFDERETYIEGSISRHIVQLCCPTYVGVLLTFIRRRLYWR